MLRWRVSASRKRLLVATAGLEAEEKAENAEAEAWGAADRRWRVSTSRKREVVDETAGRRAAGEALRLRGSSSRQREAPVLRGEARIAAGAEEKAEAGEPERRWRLSASLKRLPVDSVGVGGWRVGLGLEMFGGLGVRHGWGLRATY